MTAHKDIAGRKFGRLTAAFVCAKMRDKRVKWLCACSCGGVAEVSVTQLLRGKTQSCGCLQRERASEVKRGPTGEVERNAVLSGYVQRARRKGRPFRLRRDAFFEMVTKPCTYCGRSGTNSRRSPYGREPFRHTGIDRIDSNKGYVKGNVVPCCKDCNRAKADMPLEEFLAWRALLAPSPTL